MTSDTDPDVPAELRKLPVGAVFTHGRTDLLPDSWIKVAENTYRRSYDWVRFTADAFATWPRVELTDPIPGSITQAEADAREAKEQHRQREHRRGDQ